MQQRCLGTVWGMGSRGPGGLRNRGTECGETSQRGPVPPGPVSSQVQSGDLGPGRRFPMPSQGRGRCIAEAAQLDGLHVEVEQGLDDQLQDCCHRTHFCDDELSVWNRHDEAG